MNKEAFMHIDKIGDLFLEEILLEYIYPRVFVCRDEHDKKYVFYEVISKDNIDTWVVAKITKKEYCSLINKKTSIKDVYIKKSKNHLFTAVKTYKTKGNIISPFIDANFDIDNARELVNKLPDEKNNNSKSTAREMFEKLGYKKCCDNDDQILDYMYRKNKEVKMVSFKLTEKTFYSYRFYEVENWYKREHFDIDMKLLKAINKQVKELGWG